MPLQHIIAHRINRTLPDQDGTVQQAGGEWEVNGITDALFRDMKYNALRRSGKEYGSLSDDTAMAPACGWLRELVEERLGFLSYSQRLAKQVTDELNKTEAAIQGFLVIADETLEAERHLHVYFVQHESGLYLDGELALAESEQLDINNIRLAAKICIDDWQSDESYRQANALTLLRWRGEKELSDAFAAALGFSEKLDVGAETEAFLEVVSEYTAELPEEVATHTRKQVVDYCLEQEQSGRPVVIKELSGHLDDHRPQTENPFPAPPKFHDYIAERAPAAKPELIPDKNRMRNYVRFSGRNELLSMSFASSCLGDSVIYDAASDSLTIKNVPSALKQKLKKHITGKGEED